MYRYPVGSSRIKNVGWLASILEIEFHDGAVYQYYNVSKSEYESFINADSLGHELSILDKTHSYNRVI